MEAGLLFSAIKTTTTVAQSVAGFQQARNEAANDEVAAYTADTRALQRDAVARDDLNRTLAAIRANIAASGMSLFSPTSRAVLAETDTTLNRERVIASGNDRTEAANLRRSARSKRSYAPISLVTGAARAAPSLIDLMGL